MNNERTAESPFIQYINAGGEKVRKGDESVAQDNMVAYLGFVQLGEWPVVV